MIMFFWVAKPIKIALFSAHQSISVETLGAAGLIIVMIYNITVSKYPYPLFLYLMSEKKEIMNFTYTENPVTLCYHCKIIFGVFNTRTIKYQLLRCKVMYITRMIEWNDWNSVYEWKVFICIRCNQLFEATM